MSGRWRRRALLMTVWILAAVATFTTARMLRTDDSGDRGKPQVAATDAAGVDGAIDVTAAFNLAVHSPETTWQITEDQARKGPPREVENCRQFAAWAQQNGAIQVGIEPIHILSLQARRPIDALSISVEAKPVAPTRPRPEEGPWVAMTCRNDGSGPKASPVGGLRPESEVSPIEPYVLSEGQTLELPVTLSSELFPSKVSDYVLEAIIEVDGVLESHELRNGNGYYRCCGRITFMGYLSATYEWTLSPVRHLRQCEELRYVGKPPPQKCSISNR